MRAAIAAVGVLLAVAGAAGAQSATEVATELDPIECYWRTSAAAVRVGERFTVQLTCGVIETAAMTVALDRSRMDPAVVPLPPFEVHRRQACDGHHDAERRFFQYQLQLRYIDEAIGKDLAVRADARVPRAEPCAGRVRGLESRDREYILPPRSVRILSLLPPVSRRHPRHSRRQRLRRSSRTGSGHRCCESCRWRAHALSVVVAHLAACSSAAFRARAKAR